jgi:hypothetical protein
MASATALLVLPLVVFTGIDRDWFGGGDATTAGAVRVELSNWKVAPATSELQAGKVTFDAVHLDDHGHGGGHEDEGGATHDLVVSKKLADGSYEVVGRTDGIATGGSELLTVELDAGEYLLSCSIVEEIDGEPVSHQAQGMVATVRVT